MKGNVVTMEQVIVRISKGHFDAARLEEVRELIAKSLGPLQPAIEGLSGLIYYHAAVDGVTNTVVNVSVWKDLASAKQMDTLKAMLEQRPVLEAAGVKFDRIANYAPTWTSGKIG